MAWLRIKPIRIRSWFPPHEPIAGMIAKLCILREDLLLEMQGMAAQHIPKVDDNTEGYRRLYFWRNHLRTLEETARAFNHLASDAAFRDALAREPTVYAAFNETRRKFNLISEGYLRRFRNVIGGHVDTPVLKAGLDLIDSRLTGYLQTGDTKNKIHYRFASELILAALAHSMNEAGKVDVEAIVGECAELLGNVWPILDDLIACYAAERRLS